MTDAQVVTISTAFLAAIITVLFNNSRIGDLRDSVNQRFGDLDGSLNRRFDEVNRHIDDKFNLLAERLQRMGDNIMRILGDHENRISRLEGKQ
jgi:hypothetical protein